MRILDVKLVRKLLLMVHFTINLVLIKKIMCARRENKELRPNYTHKFNYRHFILLQLS